MKKSAGVFSLAMSAVLVMSGLAGCSRTEIPPSAAAAESMESKGETAKKTAPEETVGTQEQWEYRETTLSLLIDNDVSPDGLRKVCDLAKETLGITVEIEYKTDDSVLKARLAAGEMTDLLVFNSGSLLSALNPSEYFIDLTDQIFVEKYDDIYRNTVTVDGVVYGVPFSSAQAGAVMYYKPVYEELNLEIPHTWKEFLDNCEVIRKAGYTACISPTATRSMTQVLFLGDYYNVTAENPDFVKEFEKGNAKYALDEAALKSWKKYEDVIPYLQKDHVETTYDQACGMLACGQGVHWICLTQALSNIYSMYGEDAVNQIGVFGIPGERPDDHGLTVWMPNSLYGSLHSDKREDILRFMEFYISDEALKAYAEAVIPDGPYCIKGFSLPKGSCEGARNDMQAYFDQGKTRLAMEFETEVKGADCSLITQSLISGLITGEEAAAEYDESCKLQAFWLGFDWE